MAGQNPQVGLPGNSAQVPSGQVTPTNSRQPYLYQYGQQRQVRHDLNPMNSLPARTVKNEARKKINEYLREHGRQLYGENDDPPNLLLLIELMNYTLEPLRTDAYYAFQDLSVEISTSQPVRVQWKRVQYETVPYEVRALPIAVARALLTQIQHYVFAIDPVQDQRSGLIKGRQLNASEVIHISHKRYRAPNKQEAEFLNRHAKRFESLSPIRASRAQNSGGALNIDLDPEDKPDATIDGNAALQPSSDGLAHGFAPGQPQITVPPAKAHATVPGVNAPAQGSTSMQDPMQAPLPTDYDPKGQVGIQQGAVGLPDNLVKPKPPVEPVTAGSETR